VVGGRISSLAALPVEFVVFKMVIFATIFRFRKGYKDNQKSVKKAWIKIHSLYQLAGLRLPDCA